MMAVLSSPTEEQVDRLSDDSALEAAALKALFPRVAGVALLILVLLLGIRGNASSIPADTIAAKHAEGYNRAVYAIAVIAAVGLVIRFVRRPAIKPSRIALLVCIVGMLVGIAYVERTALTVTYWEGFGISLALVAVPVSLLIVPIAARLRRARTIRVALTGLATMLALADFVSLIRDLGNFTLPYGNYFAVNEMLAPAASRVPDANFVPQYTTLFGWIILPFRSLLSASGMANMAIILLSAFAVASVVLAIVIARRTLPTHSLWIAIGFTVPMASVTVLHGMGSIADFLSQLPIRLFPAMLFSLFATSSLITLLRRSVPRASLIGLGLFAGLMAWNSHDFGIAVTVAFAVVLQLAARGALRKPATLFWVYGLVPGLLLYPLWTAATGHTIQMHYLGINAFSGVQSAVPIWIPGPVMIVMPLVVGSAAVGWFLLWKAGDEQEERPSHEKYAVVTLALVGTWSVTALPYYINSASAAGQLQIFLLPFGICACALLSLCYPAIARQVKRSRNRPWPVRTSRSLWLLPVTIPMGACAGAILQTPNPVTSYNALANPVPANGYLAQIDGREILVAQQYAKSHGSGTVGYLGPDGNYYHLLTGVRSLDLFDVPLDFLRSPSARHAGCEFVRHHATQWLVAAPDKFYTLGTTSVVLPATYKTLGTKICGVYEPFQLPNEPPNTIFKRIRSTS